MLLALLLPACVENDPPAKDEAARDSAGETGETAGGPTECPDEPAPDAAVAASAECAAAPVADAFELVEKWSVDVEGSVVSIGVDRVADNNGDGGVDARDAQTLSVLHGEADLEVELFDATGASLGVVLTSAVNVPLSTGDVDPARTGAELVAMSQAEDTWYHAVFDESGLVSRHPASDLRVTDPFVTDLEGDGVAEVLTGGWVVDGPTGVPVWEVDAVVNPSVAVAADLDGDGVEEVVVADSSTAAATILSADGALRGVCGPATGPSGDELALAIADMDGDAEGEVVLVGSGGIAVCDPDGATVAAAAHDLTYAGSISVGQLDADALPELVVADALGVMAFDDDLTPLWTSSTADELSGVALADLDGDGLHEAIVALQDGFDVLGPDGASRARVDLPPATLRAWRRQPVVADLDGDGLAALVTGTDTLVAYTTPSGGWPVRHAGRAWPTFTHHPDDRTDDGAVAPPSTPWTDRDTNVWNAAPLGSDPLPDLSLTLGAPCLESCAGDLVVDVRLANVGAAPLGVDATVTLYARATREVLATQVVPAGLAAGVERALMLRVPADAAVGGVVAEVVGGAECGVGANVVEDAEDPCP